MDESNNDLQSYLNYGSIYFGRNMFIIIKMVALL